MKTWIVIVTAVAIGALAAAATRPEKVAAPKPPLPRVQGTLPRDLDAALSIARTRLAQDPADAPAAIRAAEILLRKARIDRNGGYALQAEQVLEALLDRRAVGVLGVEDAGRGVRVAASVPGSNRDGQPRNRHAGERCVELRNTWRCVPGAW